jgi:hypothetical protein
VSQSQAGSPRGLGPDAGPPRRRAARGSVSSEPSGGGPWVAIDLQSWP